MEEAKHLLRAWGIPESELQRIAYDVYQAIDDMYEREDVSMVAEDMKTTLTEPQLREALARWRGLDSYGELDREGIEYAIKQVLKGDYERGDARQVRQ